MKNLWLYFGTTMLISATPGPNMLLALAKGAQLGWRKTLPTIFGSIAGVVFYLVIALSGAGAILATQPELFKILKICGGGYLAYLGLKQFRDQNQLKLLDATSSPNFWQQARTGLAVSLSNPKAILFGLAFFPGFIVPDIPIAQQAIVLIGIFLLIEFWWQSCYAGFGASIARFLSTPANLGIFNRVTGLIFFALGCWMALN